MASGYAVGFASLTDEHAGELAVEGAVPQWLDGSLVRNGPALFDAGGESVDHWFDGLAMLRTFAFRDGSVRYVNRFLRTEAYRDARAGSLPSGFATGATTAARLRALLAGPPDNANVNVARLGGRYVALTEAPTAVAFDPRTLATRGRLDLAGDPAGHVVSAHPVHDPARGVTVGVDVRFTPRPRYRVYRVPDDAARREVVATVPVREPAYVHSFALTERYAVVTEPPFAVSPLSLLRPGADAPVERYEWTPERGTRFLLVDRRTGDVVSEPRTDAFFLFHHAGAFERGGGGSGGSAGESDGGDGGNGGDGGGGGGDDGGGGSAASAREVVVDLVAFPDASPVRTLSLERLRAGAVGSLGGELRRYRLDPRAGTVAGVETLHEGGFAQPRTADPGPIGALATDSRADGAAGDATTNGAHDESAVGHRYVYGQGNPPGSGPTVANELRKVDCETGAAEEWAAEDCYVGEPVVVRRPGGEGEDDGVVLAVALDADAGRSLLVVLDAASMDEVARAPLPHALPFDFHGQFFPGVR